MRPVAVSAVTLLLGIAAAHADSACERAALNYYCTGALTALGQAATEPDLANALKIRARDLHEEAEGLGHTKLKSKYQRAGVEDAAKSDDSESRARLLALCIETNQQRTAEFQTEFGDCPKRRESVRQKKPD